MSRSACGIGAVAAFACLALLSGCAGSHVAMTAKVEDEPAFEAVQDLPAPSDEVAHPEVETVKAESAPVEEVVVEEPIADVVEEPVAEPAPITSPASPISIETDMRSSFDHGPKDAAHQRYIVLHDTEVDASPYAIVNSWDSSGKLVAAHFVVGRDGTIVQCVPLDRIAHHAGYGDAGHNAAYGIEEDGRDDMAGSVPIGAWAPDYAMNAWSVGIEMAHCSGDGYYPEEQLSALDGLISYIDEYFGFQSAIIDHKAWRSGNSDTSPEFAGYLANYQTVRHH